MNHNADGSDPRPEVRPSLRVPRPDETVPADEMAILRGWLTYLRVSAIDNLDGLDDTQVRWKPAPTANSLGGLLVHLGHGERFWFRVVFADEPMDLAWARDRYAATFVMPDGWSAADAVAFYRAETSAADAVLARAESLDESSAAAMRSTTLRWIVTHVIEETARHLGHMDITRELIDGRIGR